MENPLHGNCDWGSIGQYEVGWEVERDFCGETTESKLGVGVGVACVAGLAPWLKLTVKRGYRFSRNKSAHGSDSSILFRTGDVYT
jgi:hypothetical protein